MRSRQIDKVYTVLPSLSFSPLAAQKLRLYVDLCPSEISGLGDVESSPRGFLVQDVFLVKQQSSYSYTELLPEFMAEFLISRVKEGKDPDRIKLWWHSHSEMDVFWSLMDDYTAKSFQNDYMLSLVTNKAGKYLCRLDLYQPLTLTIDHLPVVPPGRFDDEGPGLRESILKEISEQVIFYSEEP